MLIALLRKTEAHETETEKRLKRVENTSHLEFGLVSVGQLSLTAERIEGTRVQLEKIITALEGLAGAIRARVELSAKCRENASQFGV